MRVAGYTTLLGRMRLIHGSEEAIKPSLSRISTDDIKWYLFHRRIEEGSDIFIWLLIQDKDIFRTVEIIVLDIFIGRNELSPKEERLHRAQSQPHLSRLRHVYNST